jgi:hypothetical protein
MKRSRYNVLIAGLAAVLIGLAGCRSVQSLPQEPSAADRAKRAVGGEGALRAKALLFEEKIGRRHLTPEGLLAYAIDPGREPVHPTAFADMAIWSGTYLAAEGFRWMTTGESGAEDRIRTLASGIELLVTVSGKPGLLARGVRRVDRLDAIAGWRVSDHRPDLAWLGDVSVDQVDGVLFGAGVAYDATSDPAIRKTLAGWGAAIVDHLLEHRMTIEDVGGRGTKHGDLTCGLFSEDLNCLIALSAVKVAHHLTGEPRFAKAYEMLVHRGYPERAVSARRPWWEWWIGVNHSDNNLAFLAYYNLIRYETDPGLKALYLRSLDRAWSVVRRDRNPFFTYLYFGLRPAAEKEPALEEAMESLIRFPADPKGYQAPSPEGLCVSRMVDRFGRGQACGPLPINERPPTPIQWNENPARLGPTGMRSEAFSGVDYLLAYWLGRAHGFVSPGA